MKAQYFALTLLTAIAMALSPLASVGADAGDFHSGKGTVLWVDVEGRRILMTEEPDGTHMLVLELRTKVVDETGRRIAATALRPGDLVREECRLVEDDNGVATEIRLLRPAWMEIASPEQ
ncbi:MAG: hypothetical protein HYS14_11025 [Candidatus Rokubacteria bacterium]|nr:hypothetical protein [Candidatus Rokubacteria bacterium]